MLDVKDRTELQMTLETKLRQRERQGETDAKALEVAGGFAPPSACWHCRGPD